MKAVLTKDLKVGKLYKAYEFESYAGIKEYGKPFDLTQSFESGAEFLQKLSFFHKKHNKTALPVCERLCNFRTLKLPGEEAGSVERLNRGGLIQVVKLLPPNLFALNNNNLHRRFLRYDTGAVITVLVNKYYHVFLEL